MPPCPAPACKNMYMTGLVAPCEYCKREHCVSHIVPETHGCRDAAKNAAKMFVTRDAHEVREQKKANSTQDARAKLEAKKKELAAARQKK